MRRETGEPGTRTRRPGIGSDAVPALRWAGTGERRACGVGGSDMAADTAIAVGCGTLVENVPAHLVVTAILPGQSIATHFAAQH